MDVATRSADWLADIVDLMREPTCILPVVALLSGLRRAFVISHSSWNWFDPDGSFGMVVDPPDMPRNERETLDLWRTGELFDAHALLQWFRITGDLQPQTMARVPNGIVARRRRLALERAMTAMGQEHQLSITYRHDGPTHRAFVLIRGGSDFTDDDLALAGVVQRSLVALDHQVTVMQRLAGAGAGADLGLTGRELAVLQVIAEGATTRRAARILACSPRTVEKHLEHAYRRLGVNDRLNAVRVLRLAGVLGAVPVPDHCAIVAPGSYESLARWAPTAHVTGSRRT